MGRPSRYFGQPADTLIGHSQQDVSLASRARGPRVNDIHATNVGPDHQQWLRVTLSSIGDGVIATDADGSVVFLNPIAESLTGWPEDEARGQLLHTVFRIVNESTRQIVENPVAKVLATGRIVALANHTVLIARDGTERAIDDSAAPIQGGDGNIAGVVLVFRDVTERRKVEQSTRFLASIVESSDDAIVGKDVNGIVTSWNRGAERIFGYSADEMVGQPIATIAPPDRADEMPAILERIKRGEQVEHFDTVRRAKDGQLTPISLTVSPIKDEDGNIIGASKIARDISERKRAEAALQEERARLHTTLVGIGDAVIVADAEASVTLTNPVAQSLTGWPEEEALGRPLDEVFRIVNEETRQPVESPVAKVLREKTIVGLANHTILIAKDGSELPIDDSGAPICDADGNIVAVVLVFRDVADRRRAEERLRLLWEAASVLLSSNEPDAMLRELFAHIGPHLGLDMYLNYQVSDNGDSLDLVSCAGVSDEIAESIARREFDQAICGTVALERHPIVATHIQQSDDPKAQLVKSQGIRAYACNPLQVGDDLFGTLSFASRSRDEFEEEELNFLRTICQYAAVAYGRLRLVERLREADRKKDQFLATLAHELRNPLAPIRTGLELMKMAQNPATVAEAQATMDRQVNQMVRLVDDLLDVSRIANGKIVLQKDHVELVEVIRNAVDSIRPFIDEQQHELTVSIPDEPLYLNVDVIRVAQAVSNLLNNASKYSDKGGRIWLTAEQRDGEVIISVRDGGIGIDAEQLPRIFEMFSQAASALDRSQGGLGIGLSLVKGLIDLHGGSIEASSDGAGKGSEFKIRLPVAAAIPSQAHEPIEIAEVSSTTKRRRILVVDDNRDAATMLTRALELMGHEPHIAYDGLQAVQAAAALRPDVVLLDIGLPKLNGYEAARHIRGQEWGNDMQLIAISGWGQDEDKRRAVEAGFNHHLTKPVEHALLQAALGFSDQGVPLKHPTAGILRVMQIPAPEGGD
jgi:PAS domain S-box-containing protein